MAGCAIWLMLPGSSDAQNSPTPPQQGAVSLNNAVAPAEVQAAPSQPLTTTVGVAPATPGGCPGQSSHSRELAAGRAEDFLAIVAPGRAGSKALVTFTLRNANEYAVKDIEIACSFTRRDGRHLTDRKRLIGDTVEMKSRKTLPKCTSVSSM